MTCPFIPEQKVAPGDCPVWFAFSKEQAFALLPSFDMNTPSSPILYRLLALLVLCALSPASAAKEDAFSPGDWSVRCWNGETRLWEDLGLGKMTTTQVDGATRITNSSGIHRHAHLVYPKGLAGDFTFTIELRGGYELGFLNEAGKDEMLYVELEEKNGSSVAGEFHRFEISRSGTRFTIRRNGRVLPMVHFQFDYSEAFVITLAIKEGESAEIRSVTLDPAP